MSGENGLAHYAFWHVASHAFHDGVTGRLSGIALYDRDMWLDEVWECAPLPPLVVLSACSGNRSHVCTGDEHVGLATTCLAAGARQVIGSLWPIRDQLAADFISRFYDYYLAGHAPGHALALAQRSALEDSMDAAHAYQGYPGIVHGGIVAAMLDEVVGRVAMLGDHHHFMMSVRMEVKYRHPVPTETPLRITGRIVGLRGRLGKAAGEIALPDGTVAAEAVLTLADVPQEMLANANLEALGWRVDSNDER